MSHKILTKNKSRLLVSILNKFKTPTSAMFHTWIIWLALYIISPFYYTSGISLTTCIFILLCLVAFGMGDYFVTYKRKNFLQYSQRKSNAYDQIKTRSNQLGKSFSVEKVVRYCAVIGIIGATMVVLSKIFLTGLDFSSGVSGARIDRANDVLTGNAASSPIWVYPGMLTFPLGTCAFLICLLCGEYFSKFTQQLCKLAAFSPISVAVINGGRGGILYFIFMCFGAFIVRLYTQNSLEIPNLKIKKFLLISVIALLVYNVYIFESRRQIMLRDDFFDSLSNWESNYGIAPVSWFLSLVNSGYLEGNILINWMQTHFYITSGPVILSQIIESGRSFGPFFGQAQIGMLGGLLDRTIPTLSMSNEIQAATNQMNVTGLIPSGWGMIFMDIGWFALIESFVLGLFSAIIYDSAINESKLSSKLMFCFVFASISLSPIAAPLGFSDNAFTFVAILFTCFVLDRVNTFDVQITK